MPGGLPRRYEEGIDECIGPPKPPLFFEGRDVHGRWVIVVGCGVTTGPPSMLGETRRARSRVLWPEHRDSDSWEGVCEPVTPPSHAPPARSLASASQIPSGDAYAGHGSSFSGTCHGAEHLDAGPRPQALSHVTHCSRRHRPTRAASLRFSNSQIRENACVYALSRLVT